ncbi:methylenetetrahydrofolate reductase [Candidatus Bipolaricaulota bacterium]|jgi:5,10-methylenetetrahydrofolate reductase|nr:methylenetetrahydrofolate reductase [Candidatus Bipolaricaulota bacterium]MCK4681925.1 methylenetetrahydrofolate reductase [Candidatus Bipolaricaulota bacterium]
MTSLQQALAKGEFAVTAEVAPPKGTDTAEMMENAEFLRGKVHAVNVTDQQSSVMRLGSLASCRLLKESGFEPVFQLATRDRNRIALQSDLLSSYALGIENVLCLTGDHVTLGDHPQAKSVFDLDSVSLLMAAKGLAGGTDMAGESLEGVPTFHLGAVVTPGYEPMELQLLKMERKIKAGAQFFQTQAVYDPELFRRFMEGAKALGVPVMLGFVLLKSAGMARYMNKNVAGVSVPDSIIDEMKKTDDKVATSIKIAARIIRKTREMCQGIHLMTMGWERHVPAILQEAGISIQRGSSPKLQGG